jgi:hypothetical protein
MSWIFYYRQINQRPDFLIRSITDPKFKILIFSIVFHVVGQVMHILKTTYQIYKKKKKTYQNVLA